MRKNKLILAIALVSQLIVPLPKTTSAEGNLPLSIGDYITLGRYYDEPILWRCIDIDGYGMLILSDQILSIKCFDVGGEASGGSHTSENNPAPYHYYYDRERFGSNYWADSNIRCWLNSTAPEQSVKWICQNPPVDLYYTRGYSYQKGYDNEKGFLSDDNFSKDEVSLMKSVTLKNLLDPLDEYKSIDGTPNVWKNWNVYKWKEKTPFENGYGDICFEYIVDKVFLLDIAQFYEAMQNESILGENYINGLIDATQSAIENDIKPDSIFADRTTFPYWLRTPYGDGYQYVFDDWDYGDRVFTSSSVEYAEEMLIGVRPAFYLNEDTMVIRSGSGSESDPYVIDGKASYINVGDVVGNIYSTDIVTYVDDIPITAYNIGGKTIIPIEDLRDYGFDVNWNEEDKVLEASVSEAPVYGSGGNGSSGVTGSVAGNIYHTDITLFVNGIPLGSYNIGGVTCAAVEDLGADSDTDEVLSKYGMRYTYNDSDRTLRLYIKR